MKTTCKKTVLLLLILSGIISCANQEMDSHIRGKIIGYTKCNVDNNDLTGLFIITEKQDSLLSFNIPLSSINIVPNSLYYGVYNIDGGSIGIEYRVAVGEEIKQMSDFLCPQSEMLPGFTHGQIENYTQVIITDIINENKEGDVLHTELLSGKWELVKYVDIVNSSIEERPNDIAKSVEINFISSDSIAARSLANDINGNYLLHSNCIQFYNLITTLVFEPSWGSNFIDALYNTDLIKIKEDKLCIYYNQSSKVMLFNKIQ
jgi:hypothetical protein